MKRFIDIDDDEEDESLFDLESWLFLNHPDILIEYNKKMDELELMK